MKLTSFITSLLFLISCILCIPSCTNSDSGDPSQMIIAQNIQLGTWKITSFVDSGNDETNHFSDFTFLFGGTGTITATNGSVTHSGTWNLTDNSSDDNSLDDLDFNIFFNLTNNFEDLNDDWHFISQSATRIELTHVSGGNGGIDYLTFEKS